MTREKRDRRRRLLEWEEQGVLVAVHQHLLALLDEQGKLQMEEAFLGGTFVPAKKGGDKVGKTKAGKGTMVATDANGTPLNTVIAGAEVHEHNLAKETLDGIQVAKHRKRGKVRPQKKVPKRVISDKGYDDDSLRREFAQAGIDFIVPYRSNRVNRPFADGRKLRRYWRRCKVERTNAWLKHFRRVTVRWDRSITAYQGFVHIACICITRMKF